MKLVDKGHCSMRNRPLILISLLHSWASRGVLPPDDRHYPLRCPAGPCQGPPLSPFLSRRFTVRRGVATVELVPAWAIAVPPRRNPEINELTVGEVSTAVEDSTSKGMSTVGAQS